VERAEGCQEREDCCDKIEGWKVRGLEGLMV